jgi:hypothetical protein
MKIIPICEHAEPTCTCTKWVKIIITLSEILIYRISFGLKQKQVYRHMALIVTLYPGTQHFSICFIVDLLEEVVLLALTSVLHLVLSLILSASSQTVHTLL